MAHYGGRTLSASGAEAAVPQSEKFWRETHNVGFDVMLVLSCPGRGHSP